jgi:hypothetical protein
LRASAGERWQAAQNKLCVRDSLTADLEQRVRHGTGAVRRQHKALDFARRIIQRRRFGWKHICRRADATSLDCAQKFWKVDHPGAAHEQHGRPGRYEIKLALAQETLVLAGDGRENDNHLR